MPSDFLTPFLELDEEFCKKLGSLDATDGWSGWSGWSGGSQLQRQQRVLGFQRRHSLCPVTLPNSKFNGEASGWGPRSSLSHIPFRADRSVSMIEGPACGPSAGEDGAPLPPPPGLPPPPAHVSTRYKTELCRTYEESGACKYGAKCQFAHGPDELRGLSRHPKYKTEPCRTFHTIGFCPYGARCHFVHNADEAQPGGAGAPRQRPRPPLLRHSLSFAGFSSSPRTPRWAEESRPSSLLLARASSVSPPPSCTESPELLSPLLQRCVADLALGDSALRFYAVTDAPGAERPAASFKSPKPALRLPRPAAPPPGARPGLQRCSSADSLSEEGYASSCSLSSASSGAESPGLEGRRLPIFSRLAVTDE